MPDKAIYQPWSEEAFAADIDVQAMTPIQRWMYRTLCQKAFVCSTRPFPPDDDSILWKLSGCPSAAFWNQQKEPVRAMFESRIVSGVQVLFRKKLADDWTKVQNIKEANRKNIEKRWRDQRENQKLPAPIQVPCDTTVYDGIRPNTTVLQVSKEVKGSKVSELDSKDIAHQKPVGVPYTSDFDVFWLAYPRKVGKPAAFRAWRAHVKDPTLVMGGLELWGQSKQWADENFIPHPATFLNQHRWEDIPAEGGSRGTDIERSIAESIELGKEYGIGGGNHQVGHALGRSLQPERAITTTRKEGLYRGT